MQISEILTTYQEQHCLTNRQMVMTFSDIKDFTELDRSIRTYQNWKKGKLPNHANIKAIKEGFSRCGAQKEAEAVEEFELERLKREKEMRKERNKRYRTKKMLEKAAQQEIIYDAFGNKRTRAWLNGLMEEDKILGFPPFMSEEEKAQMELLYPSQEEFDAMINGDEKSPCYIAYTERAGDIVESSYWKDYAVHFYETCGGMRKIEKGVTSAPVGVFLGIFNKWFKYHSEGSCYLGDKPLSVICRMATFLSIPCNSYGLKAGTFEKHLTWDGDDKREEIHDYDDSLEYADALPFLQYGKGKVCGKYKELIDRMCTVHTNLIHTEKENDSSTLFKLGSLRLSLTNQFPAHAMEEYEVVCHPDALTVNSVRKWIEVNHEHSPYFEWEAGTSAYMRLN